MSALELYHWQPVGDSLKALICLKEKGAEFSGRFVDVPAFEQYRPDYLKLAPSGRVPVLVHRGEAFGEPKLLCEYIEEAFPDPALAPRDAAGWYDVQEWIRFADAQLGASVDVIGWHTVTWPAMSETQRGEFQARLARVPVKEQQAGWAAVVRDAESTENQVENARGRVRDALARMEGALGRTEFLAGGMYSIADICAFSWARTLPRLMAADVNGTKTPRVLAWLNRVGDRRAVRAALNLRRGETARDDYWMK